MINNCNIDDFKKKSFKLIGTLALSGILTFNLTGCVVDEAKIENDNTIKNEQQLDDEHHLPTTRCVIDITGDYENYTKDGRCPHFSFFYKKAGEDEWKIYSVFKCDGEEKDINLIEGNFLIYSRDIGQKEIYVDDTDDVYSVTLDYSNKTIDFQKTIDNNKSL